MTDITPIPRPLDEAVIKQRGDNYSIMQAQLKKTGESVKSAHHVLYQVVELVRQSTDKDLIDKVEELL